MILIARLVVVRRDVAVTILKHERQPQSGHGHSRVAVLHVPQRINIAKAAK